VIQPRAIFQVIVNGVDYSSRFEPVLKTIEVTDGDGKKSDSASITVADPEGSTYMPEPDAKVQILLGHEGQGVGLCFKGKVETVRSSGSKGGGRELKITARGLDTKSKAKEPAERTAADKTFGEVVDQWAKAAGMDGVRIAPALRNVRRAWWGMQNESFIHWMERMADELGGTFRVSDNEAVMVEAGAGQSASGKTLPTVTAEFGRNMISWDIDPFTGRAQTNRARVRFYDRENARFREVEAEVEDTNSRASSRRAHAASSEASARQNAGSDKKKSKRKKGGGTVTILGDSHARPEGTLVVVGAREGVDGDYKITSITHSFSKSAGFTTRISFGDSKAGKDKRRKRGRGGGAADGGRVGTAAAPGLEVQ
jgi:phage protein D